MSAPAPRVMRTHPQGDFRTCGACSLLYHVRELHPGRGRHLDEHPEHEYAPCGHSQTWHGSSAAEVEPEPLAGLELFDSVVELFDGVPDSAR